jgi:hypothetical protein
MTQTFHCSSNEGWNNEFVLTSDIGQIIGSGDTPETQNRLRGKSSMKHMENNKIKVNIIATRSRSVKWCGYAEIKQIWEKRTCQKNVAVGNMGVKHAQKYCGTKQAKHPKLVIFQRFLGLAFRVSVNISASSAEYNQPWFVAPHHPISSQQHRTIPNLHQCLPICMSSIHLKLTICVVLSGSRSSEHC